MTSGTLFTLFAAATLPFAIPAGGGPAEIPYRGDGHFMLNADDLEWRDVGSMPPPAEMAIIEGELGKEEPFTFRLRFPAGYELRPHVHPAYERLTVISGNLHFAHGEEFDREKTMELRQGGVAIMPPGEPMFGYAAEETVIQLHGTGPWAIRYINPEDDPRN